MVLTKRKTGRPWAQPKAPSTLKAQSKSPRRPPRSCTESSCILRLYPITQPLENRAQGRQMTGSWPLRLRCRCCWTLLIHMQDWDCSEPTAETFYSCFRKWRQTLLGFDWSDLSSGLTDGWHNKKVALVVKLSTFLSIDLNKSQCRKTLNRIPLTRLLC